jgi:hypothetical protein
VRTQFPELTEAARYAGWVDGMDAHDHIGQLRQELATVSEACQAARQRRDAGQLFFLLRKQWRLTQRLSQAEAALGQTEQAKLAPDGAERPLGFRREPGDAQDWPAGPDCG